jgi:hypothetical protein
MTLVGFLISALKRTHKAESERFMFEVAIENSVEVVKNLKAQEERYKQQIEVLRNAVKELDDLVISNASSDVIRIKLDELLSKKTDSKSSGTGKDTL